jgi:23S rRNA pseudouridine2605 synthase
VVLPDRLKGHSFYELDAKELELLFEFAGLKWEGVQASKPYAIKPDTKKPKR